MKPAREIELVDIVPRFLINIVYPSLSLSPRNLYTISLFTITTRDWEKESISRPFLLPAPPRVPPEKNYFHFPLSTRKLLSR